MPGLRQQRGNAVLFSLIIIAAAMVISLGMVTLVANEARTVGLVVPGEKAYYKAESFVEQALWEKAKGPQGADYQAENRNDLPATYLCEDPVKAPPCFEGEASSPTNADLKEFAATTSPIDDEIGLQPDVARQFDINTDSATGSGTVELSNIVGEEGFRGLEVTIVAYPSSSANLGAKFPVDEDNPLTPGVVEGATTAVFIDKILVPPGNNGANIPDQQIDINQARQNALGENYLPFNDDSIYRVRLKALGAAATLNLTAESTNGELSVVSPDFTVRSVAQDGSARRGLQVLLPASSQSSNIFDFVLFSDLDLDKLRSKVPGTTNKSITARVYRDTDQDCVRDPGEPVIPDVTVTANPGYQTTTNPDGVAPFNNLNPGTGYTVTVQAPSGTEFCPLPGGGSGNPQSFTFNGLSGPANAENVQMNFVVRTPLPPRAPVYRWFYNYGFHNGYYDYDFYHTFNASVTNYTFQGISFFTFSSQLLGQIPIYAYQVFPNFGAKYYSTSPVGTNPRLAFYAAPYSGSCPNGSVPIYSMTHPSAPPYVSNLLTVNLSERAALIAQGWVSNGVLACAWTTP